MLVAGLLAYGVIVYLLARIGHLARLRATADVGAYEPALDEEPDDESALVVLVPSYLEDPHIVQRALIAAALQPHPNRRVVLLIDDPPDDPRGESLKVTRGLPGQVAQMLRPMRDHCERALRGLDERAQDAGFSLAAEARHLADLCWRSADWFETQALTHPIAEFADGFFIDLTFRAPASRWRRAGQRWAELADAPAAPLSADRIRRGYLRLVSVFRVEITSFERKRFVNLSHVPNKAMNVNSYLGLLGGSYRREQTDAGLLLLRCNVDDAELIIPDADFVLIQDADTIIAPDYTPKLMCRFREPDGQRLAIVQSPYSTFPGDSGVLQRIAGAQTDIQYLVHQGLTPYNATYWVGANARVRVAAMRDLAERGVERGFEIVKFIRDRTLIEDTESTIDLVRRGWRLFNQAERLAFSMTPPDFGSLLIQRRRWANGGLLIVPKLLAHLCRPGKIADRLAEGFMRLHYLISLGPVSMAMLVVVGISFDAQMRTIFLLGTGLTYYTLYARDLHLIGYRWHDIFRVMALNILLIPVSVAGMGLSLAQAITGCKARFGRTPKVHERTRVPGGYLVAEFVLLAIWCQYSVLSLIGPRPGIASFMLAHAVLLAYAIGAFIGYRNSAADLVAALTRRR